MHSELAKKLALSILKRMGEIDGDITKSEYRSGEDGSNDRPPDGDDYNLLWDAILDEIRHCLPGIDIDKGLGMRKTHELKFNKVEIQRLLKEALIHRGLSPISDVRIEWGIKGPCCTVEVEQPTPNPDPDSLLDLPDAHTCDDIPF